MTNEHIIQEEAEYHLIQPYDGSHEPEHFEDGDDEPRIIEDEDEQVFEQGEELL
jgi:hypothetical protein